MFPLYFSDPLVNVTMKPDTHVKVTISAHQETEVREELIPVYQTVGQFKAQLNQWFHIPIQNMKLYYCDQVRHDTIYVDYLPYKNILQMSFQLNLYFFQTFSIGSCPSYWSRRNEVSRKSVIYLQC